MPADKGLLVNALTRIANEQDDPRAYLMGILTGRASRISTGDGRVRIGSSTGGSSASWVVPEGMSDVEIMELAELALQQLDTGINAQITTDSITGAINLPAFLPPPNSARLISFAQFGHIQR